MKVNVIKDKCIGCGNCVALTEGQLFDFNDDGLAEAIIDVVPVEMEENAKDAIIQCPTEAIVEINEENEEVSNNKDTNEEFNENETTNENINGENKETSKPNEESEQ